MNKLKVPLDILMTILFFLLMKVSFVGIALHELIGISIFFLFIVHKMLNYKWIVGVCKNITNIKVARKTKFMFVFDCLLLVLVSFNVISGILISQTILTKIIVNDISFWSDLHHFFAYSSLVLLSVHIGLHWQALMNMFVKLLGLNKENPIQIIVARIMVVFISILGLRAIINPEINNNFIAPFVKHSLPVAQTLHNSKNETYITNTNSIMLLSTNSLVVDTPTLEEFLSKLFCSGCGRRCPLTNLQCTKGIKYKNEAIAQYESTYAQSENKPQPQTSIPTIDDSSILDNNSTLENDNMNEIINNDSVVTKKGKNTIEQIPNINLTESADLFTNTQSTTSAFDYIGLMGIIIAGTHYTINIPKKLKLKKNLKIK